MTEERRRALVARLATAERELEKLLIEIRTIRYQRQGMRDPPPLTPASRLEVAADRAQVLLFETEELKRELRAPK